MAIHGRVKVAAISTILLAGSVAIMGCWVQKPGAPPATQPAAVVEAPYGIAKRVPWTTSKVVGSPEAPDPFLTERIFPKISFTKPLDIAFAPGSNRVFVAQQEGT